MVNVVGQLGSRRVVARRQTLLGMVLHRWHIETVLAVSHESLGAAVLQATVEATRVERLSAQATTKELEASRQAQLLKELEAGYSKSLADATESAAAELSEARQMISVLEAKALGAERRVVEFEQRLVQQRLDSRYEVAAADQQRNNLQLQLQAVVAATDNRVQLACTAAREAAASQVSRAPIVPPLPHTHHHRSPRRRRIVVPQVAQHATSAAEEVKRQAAICSSEQAKAASLERQVAELSVALRRATSTLGLCR